MPENQKTLRRRIRSIKATKQITRAMEMVSAAKLRKAQQVLNAARPYAKQLQQMLAHLAGSNEGASHPFFAKGDPKGPILLVVFASDRGLCGAYNSNILRAAERWIRQQTDRKVDVYCVGRKTVDHFRRIKMDAVGTLTDTGGKVDTDAAHKMGNDLIEAFLSGRYAEVHVLYAHFVSNVLNRPTFEQYLPLEADALSNPTAHKDDVKFNGHIPGQKDVSLSSYLLEPNPRAVFEALLPHYLRSKIHIIFAESFTSEHSARMIAMNNATKNCNELRDALTLRANKARQASITKEMLEIVGGAEALKG